MSARNQTSTYLLGEEVVQTSLTQYLRKLARVSKGIRQPRFTAIFAKPRAKVALTVEVLPGKRFSRRHHAVVFEPCSTNVVESSFLDVLLDSLEALGVKLLEPEVLLR